MSTSLTWKYKTKEVATWQVSTNYWNYRDPNATAYIHRMNDKKWSSTSSWLDKCIFGILRIWIWFVCVCVCIALVGRGAILHFYFIEWAMKGSYIFISYRLFYSPRKAIKNKPWFTFGFSSFKTFGQKLYYKFIWNQFPLVDNLWKLQHKEML